MDDIVEWSKDIYRVSGHKGNGGEENSTWVIFGEKSIALIDIPDRNTGKKVLNFIKDYGRDPREIKHLILTNTHPTQWAGIEVLSKIQPKVIVHENGKEILTKGQKAILEKQFPYAARFKLAMKTSLFSNVKKLKEDVIVTFTDSMTIDLGGEELLLQHTGGHSADSIMIHAYRGKCTFIGDEANIYPDKPANFFIDATGNPTKRLKLLQLLERLKTNTICPSHYAPILKPFDIFLGDLIFEHKHVKDTIVDLLINVGQAKLLYIAEEYTNTIDIEWESPYNELGVQITTAEAFLKELASENLVAYDRPSERWKAI